MLYQPGDKVRLDLLDSHNSAGQADCCPEYGIVVHAWINESGDEDCYVAFMGCKIPNNEQPMKPYILRYYAGSLQKGWTSLKAHQCTKTQKLQPRIHRPIGIRI